MSDPFSTKFPTPFTLIPAQHTGQANQVHVGNWRGTLVAIKTPRHKAGEVNPFYVGVDALFGARLTNGYHYMNMHRLLSTHSTLPTPELLTMTPYRSDRLQPTHRYTEGIAAKHYEQLSSEGAFQYGQHLARLHALRVLSPGCFGLLQPSISFHARAAKTIAMLLREFPQDTAVQTAAETAIRQLTSLPSPVHYAPIMLDLDPTQYFIHNGRFTHLIDTDFFVFGPPELELAALEIIFPETLVTAFLAGYHTVSDIPSLRIYRTAYRTLNRLLCVQGHQPFERWHDHPHWFP